ncbi:uncharacterized protein [Centruroides vittatus]|uniref:uncharacterized protein isoform X2 n=1 Tax=Centruroides vittatus TaxID=120091 RepID=UPI00350EF9A9
MSSSDEDDKNYFKEYEMQFKKGKYIKCLQYLEELLNNFPSKSTSGRFRKLNVNKTNSIFTQWSVQHNILLCKLLLVENRSLTPVANNNQTEEKDDLVLLEQLQHLCFQVRGVPVTKESIILEIIIIHNWLNFLLLKGESKIKTSCKNEVWQQITLTLQQLFYVATAIKPTSDLVDVTTALSFIQGIGHHLNELKDLKKIALLFFCTIAWFLIQHSDVKNASLLLKSVTSLLKNCMSDDEGDVEEEEAVKFYWKTSSSTLPITQWQDIIGVTYVYCLSMNDNFEKSMKACKRLNHLSNIPFLQYLKVGKISEAVNIAHKVWKNQYNCIENRLKARICNLLGCCFSDMNKHHVAMEWFSQAIDEDETFYLSLKNIFVEFHLLKQPDQEIQSLQLLVKATANQIQHPCPYNADVTHVESLYMIAKHLLEREQYEKSAEWFTYLLAVLEEKNDNQCYRASSDFFFQLSNIYHQAAYAHLHSKNYKRCIEICSKLIEDYSSKDDLLKENISNSEASSYADSKKQFETLCIDDDKVIRILENTSSDVISLMMRSSAYYHLNDKEHALFDLKRLRIILQAKSCLSTHRIYNCAKRIKIDEIEKKEGNNEEPRENLAIMCLRSQVFNNLGVQCVLKYRYEEAMQLFRISLSCFSENTDAAYNSSLLMAFLNHKEEAIRSWIKFRKETDNIGYPTSLTTEQIRHCEQTIKLTTPKESVPQMVISDRLQFLCSTHSTHLGSIHILKNAFVPLYATIR